MTAKEEILGLMKQIPDDLSVDETIKRLGSAYLAKGIASNERKDDGGVIDIKSQPVDGAPPQIDGRGIKDRIIGIAEELPDDLTAAETICKAAENLRLFFLIQKDFDDIREGRTLPFEERDDGPAFLNEVPEIGPISGDLFERMSIKEKLVHTMRRLPDDLTLSQALIEGLERLLLMYKLDRSFEQIRNGQTIPHEEVKRILREKWQP